MFRPGRDAREKRTAIYKEKARNMFIFLAFSLYRGYMSYLSAIRRLLGRAKLIKSTLIRKGAILVVASLLVPLSVLLISLNSLVYAATSNQLNFQGRLLTNTGSLVPDGTYHVEFKLYSALTSSGSTQGSCTGDTNCLWTETRTTGSLVTIQNGYYSVYLGDVTAFPSNIDWSNDLYLGMNIGGSSGTASWDGEMTPRFKLTAVPYAFKSSNVASSPTLTMYQSLLEMP